MDTTVMKSQNSKTCKPHFLLRNITDKIDWQRGEKKDWFIKS